MDEKKAKITKSTRQGFGEAILEEGKKKKNLIVLTADLGESTQVKSFVEKYPSRFIECGVAEQNMIGMAAGLALAGKTAVTTSFGVFTPGRTLDQIRINVCYNNADVKVVATHCGLNVGEDGATHQALEDIAVMRSIPNMTVISPCDYLEAKKATKAILNFKGPVYLRLGRMKSSIITKEKDEFKIGKANVLLTGKDAVIIATGYLVEKALKAAFVLKREGVNVSVINCHTIKPLDKKTILDFAKKTKAIVTVEEHEIAGGLGSAVAECISFYLPVPIEFIGVHDKFGQSGTADELYKYYGLDENSIVKAVKKVIKRK